MGFFNNLLREKPKVHPEAGEARAGRAQMQRPSQTRPAASARTGAGVAEQKGKEPPREPLRVITNPRRAQGLDSEHSAQEAEGDRRYTRVQSIDQLPQYAKVLSEKDGEVPVPDATRKMALALQIGHLKAAILLNGDTAITSNEYRSLRGILRHHQFSVDAVYIATQDAFGFVLGASKEREESGVIHESAQSVRNFDAILEAGVKAGASDIHVCIRDNGAVVLLRVYGLMNECMTLSRDDAIEAVGVAYNKLATESSRGRNDPQFNQRRKQYCMIDRVVSGRRWRFRYQSSNVEGGLDIVMRILPAEMIAETKSLAELGYEDTQRELLKLAMMRSIGAIFVAGETGSGKSTTLMTLMTMDPERHRYKWYSVEDPVEYKMFGVSQIPVQRDTADDDNGPFIEAFRALLRMDPNVMMIGEIRDKETADLFAPAVMSGHRCLTTVHAPSGVGIAGRLSSAPIMMPRAILAGKRFISALVYQSLVPTLCPHCRKPAKDVLDYDYIAYIEDKFSVDASQMYVASGISCGHQKCQKGVAGQTVAAEVIIPDSQMLILLREGKDTEAEEMWRRTRTSGFDSPDMTGKTAFEHALYRCLKGQIDPRHLETTFESFRTYEVIEI